MIHAALISTIVACFQE